MLINRGDIFFANLDPAIGHEIKKTRPVIIVSNNAANNASPLVTVIPLTSNTKTLYSFEVLIPPEDSGLIKKSKAQCQQLRTLSKIRLSKKIAGKISANTLQQIDAALRLHLDL